MIDHFTHVDLSNAILTKGHALALRKCGDSEDGAFQIGCPRTTSPPLVARVLISLVSGDGQGGLCPSSGDNGHISKLGAMD